LKHYGARAAAFVGLALVACACHGDPGVDDGAQAALAPGDILPSGKPIDLVWRHDTNNRQVLWHLVGTTKIAEENILPPVNDANWKLQATGDFDGDGNTDYAWRNYNATPGASDGGKVAIWLLNNDLGGSFKTSISLAPVGDLRWQIVGAADFNGDRKDDLVWRNAGTGAITVWLMGLMNPKSVVLTPFTDSALTLRGAGDIDGDGQGDLVWRNAVDGTTQVWFMSRDDIPVPTKRNVQEADPRGGLRDAILDAGWRLDAVSDVDLDGKADLIFRNIGPTSQTLVWFMDGAFRRDQKEITPAVGDPGWRIAGVRKRGSVLDVPASPPGLSFPDFNGDGLPDIVWRNDVTGSAVVWYLDGSGLRSSASLPTNGGGVRTEDLSWRFAAAADFNSDGHTDLLWQNKASGKIVIWFLNGTTLIGTREVTNDAGAPLEVRDPWTIVAAADFTKDGQPDLLWRNVSSGEVVVWPTVGTSLVKTGGIYLNPQTTIAWNKTTWTIAGAGDFDANGTADIVWRDQDATASPDLKGRSVIWLMDGTNLSSAVDIQRVADFSWQIGAVQGISRAGKPDLAWRNYATGQTVFWKMDDNQFSGIGGQLTPPDADTKEVPPGQLKVGAGSGWRLGGR